MAAILFLYLLLLLLHQDVTIFLCVFVRLFGELVKFKVKLGFVHLLALFPFLESLGCFLLLVLDDFKLDLVSLLKFLLHGYFSLLSN